MVSDLNAGSSGGEPFEKGDKDDHEHEEADPEKRFGSEKNGERFGDGPLVSVPRGLGPNEQERRAMTAPRPREQRRPPSPPERLPPRPGGRPFSRKTVVPAAGRSAASARLRGARQNLLRSARALAAGAFLGLFAALALPALAWHDVLPSDPGETERVCRPLPSGPPAPTCGGGNEGGVILVGGSSPSEGSVRICHDNEYRSVCDDFFTDRSAGVVCRQLGYATGVPTRRSRFVGDTGAVSYWLDDVDCSGAEANLGDCRHPDGAFTTAAR